MIRPPAKHIVPVSFSKSKFSRNKGSTLAISLVLLTVITLIAVTSMQRSGLQTRMVANIQHVEMLFNTAMNDQEYWFTQLQLEESGDSLLSEPLSSFELDENNQRSYLPVELEPVIEEPKIIQLASSLLHIPPTEGQLSLSEGNEVNSRIDYDFQLSSKAQFKTRSMLANQQTGLSFSGLNNQQNSMY